MPEYQPDIDDELGEILEHFEVGDLSVDWDPALVCTFPVNITPDGSTECGETVCTIEKGDTLRVLVATARNHYEEHHA